MNPDITVVIVTRNRVETLLTTLARLTALPEQPPILIADNGSTDGTIERVTHQFPQVTVLALGENRGSSGRNEGVKHAKTPLVAFCDDDSFWAPGALTKAVAYFRQYPRMAVLAGHILVQEAEEPDPICDVLRQSPVTSPVPLPGPALLGFVCCAAVVRRDAFLEVGGFNPHFACACEERLFSIDLFTKGWGIAYLEDVVAHHYPLRATNRNRDERIQQTTRDTFWYYWLRRPVYYALKHTRHIHRISRTDPNVRRGFRDALRALPRILRERRVVPPRVEAQLLKIESFY